MQVQVLSVPTVEILLQKIKELNLDGQDVISHYSVEDIARIYNGIGPDRFPDWLRNFLSELNEIILPAALIHDLDYDLGGNWDDFYASNKRLGNNSIKCIKDKFGKYSLKYWFYLAKVHVFVKICNKYGKPGWNYKSC